MFSSFSMNSTRLGRAAVLAENPKHEFPTDASCLTGKEHVAAYLEPLAKTAALRDCLRLETAVQKVSRRGLLKEDSPGDAKRGLQPFRLLVREGKGRERVDEADAVIDCTGTYGQHRWIGDGGIPAVGEAACESQIAYCVENILGDRRSTYAGKSVVVVGGGYSAATTVAGLAELAEEQSDTWTVWLARSAGTQPIVRFPGDPLRERDRLAVRANSLATRGDGNVEFHNHCFIESVESAGQDKGFRVTARCAGKARTWEAERLIANVGYSPDTTIYRELQVGDCDTTLAPANLAAALAKQGWGDAGGASVPATALRNREPNFFVLVPRATGAILSSC